MGKGDVETRSERRSKGRRAGRAKEKKLGECNEEKRRGSGCATDGGKGEVKGERER